MPDPIMHPELKDCSSFNSDKPQLSKDSFVAAREYLIKSSIFLVLPAFLGARVIKVRAKANNKPKKDMIREVRAKKEVKVKGKGNPAC